MISQEAWFSTKSKFRATRLKQYELTACEVLSDGLSV